MQVNCYPTCKQLTTDVCTFVPTGAKKKKERETHSMDYILGFECFIVMIGQSL